MLAQNEHIYDHNGKREPPVYPDPTRNVLALVEAAVRRLDDIQKVELRRVDEKLQNHILYTKELAEAESKRLDAIRAVDVAAVALAEGRAIGQAASLAKQVVESAEALRALVASTATTVASQLSTIHGQLSERIAELEKSNFETTGRSKLSMPIAISMGAIVGGLIAFMIQLVLGRLIR